MNEITIDWAVIGSAFGKLLTAFVLTLPIAWERERSARSAGLRTFPLVGAASCGYVLVALSFAPGAPEAQARIVQGLITGIGFIGGGAILKGDQGVRGTATAAGIWATGATGAAVGFGEWELALVLGLVNVGILGVLTPIEKRIGETHRPSERDGHHD